MGEQGNQKEEKEKWDRKEKRNQAPPSCPCSKLSPSSEIAKDQLSLEVSRQVQATKSRFKARMLLYQQGTFLLNCTKFWPSGVFYLIYQFPVPDNHVPFTLSNTVYVCISVHANSDVMAEIQRFFSIRGSEVNILSL